jgi:hypothetical protein
MSLASAGSAAIKPGPVTKLLAQPVAVWNRRCLLLAQRGQCPSDTPVGDHGGYWRTLSVSSIRGRHVSGMKSSNEVRLPYYCYPIIHRDLHQQPHDHELQLPHQTGLRTAQRVTPKRCD